MHHLGENQNNLQLQENWFSGNERSWYSPFSASAFVAKFLTRRRGWNPAALTPASIAWVEALLPSLPASGSTRFWGTAQTRFRSPRITLGRAGDVHISWGWHTWHRLWVCCSSDWNSSAGRCLEWNREMSMCKKWFCWSSKIITAFSNKPHCRPFWNETSFWFQIFPFFFFFFLFLLKNCFNYSFFLIYRFFSISVLAN